MIYQGKKKGKYISLRAADVSDASFTGELRSDAGLCKYLHSVDATPEGQTRFLRWQRAAENDYYFIIENSASEPIGTIALYHFAGDSAELGRWVSRGNAFENLESIILIHEIAFHEFHLNGVFTCTMADNETVVNFWRKFGGDEHSIEMEEGFLASKNVVYRNTYEKVIKPKMLKLLRI